MKLVTYRYQEQEQVGILDGGMVWPAAAYGFSVRSMHELITQVPLEALCAAVRDPAAKGVPLASVRLLAPIPNPAQDVICLGINYNEHAKESAKYSKTMFEGRPEAAIYFSKRVNEAVADGDPIDSHPGLVERLDYEAELAFIIGRDARNVRAADAAQYVFGYTIINDVSARVLQRAHKQWYFGKSLDGFTPMGPCIVTRDALEFPPCRRISSRVNGELRQDSVTDRMIFDIPYLIEELSSGMTLKAGTIVSTGTPAGVGMGMDPPTFLKPGDVVECAIDGIGTLTNPVA